MTGSWLDVGLIRALLCGIVAAGIVHICATLATPHVVGPGPYKRMAEHLPVNRMMVVGAPTPKSQLLPFQEADMLFAVCSYDARQGPVVVRAVLPAAGWTLALYSPAGDNFYIMPGQDQRSVEMNAMLIAGDDETIIPSDARAGNVRLTPVQLPAPEGLLVIRAPLKGESFRAEVEAALSRASCGRMSSQQAATQ
jgi:uncharacterized membrane protein